MNDFDPLLRVGEVAKALGCSVATVWRRAADGTIPKPLRIAGISRWPQSEILATIETAKEARDA